MNNFLPIRIRRANLKLAGHGREPPSQFDILLGDHELIGPAAKRVRTTLNRATGKFDIRQLYHCAEVILPDGTKARQITVDARDRDQIPTIIKRERKRYGLPELSDDELAASAQEFTVNVIEKPLVHVKVAVGFAYLPHAMLKIAYELAFIWLGDAYLDDPLGAEIRQAICKEDLASTDGLTGYIGEAATCDAFKHWTPHEAHHIAYLQVVGDAILVAVRVFDLYAAAVVVSRDPSRYVCNAADLTKLRFLAIDSVSRRTINTTFDAETYRLAALMTALQRLPPFPDPL